jgi:hypothetical protein
MQYAKRIISGRRAHPIFYNAAQALHWWGLKFVGDKPGDRLENTFGRGNIGGGFWRSS